MAYTARTKILSRLQNMAFVGRTLLRKPRLGLRLVASYFKVAVLKRQPLRFVDLAIDYACNMRCQHCSAVNLARSTESRLTLAEYARIGADLRREGCLLFHFTGGEPLLCQDLEAIIRELRPGLSMISVQTNGLLVARERLLSLKRAGLDILCVSIDSGIAEEHDRFRNSPGAFEQAVRAVEMARGLGLQASISTCVSHANLDSEGLRKVIDLAATHQAWCIFNLAVPAGNWRENESVLFTAGDRQKLERIIAEHPHCRTDFESNYLKWGCGAVKEKVYITAYGEVMPCPFIQIALGDLRRESISLVRRRALRVPEFQEYSQVCLAAESRQFIEKCPCYSAGVPRVPVPYQQVPWMLEAMKEADRCQRPS